MESFLNYITHVTMNHLNIIVFIMSFLESLALIGLVLPGLVIMGTFGTLIGNGKLNFYYAWLYSILGCIIGDLCSYYFGIKFREKINHLIVFQINKDFIKKIKVLLCQYHFITVFFGKFIGPTRPLIPMLSGVLELSFYKFLLPNTLACIFWPVIYFFPGMLTLLTCSFFKKTRKKKYFFSIILFCVFLISLFFYIFYNRLNFKKKKFLSKIYKISKLQLNYIYFLLFSLFLVSIFFIIFTRNIKNNIT